MPACTVCQTERRPAVSPGQEAGQAGQGGRQPALQGRGPVRCIRRVKGRRGGPDRLELIVLLDLVSRHATLLPICYHPQETIGLTEEKVADYKEVFRLLDKDEDGVLSLPELGQALKLLGHRHSGTVGLPGRDSILLTNCRE